MKKVLMIATVPSMIGQFNLNNINILLNMGYEVHVACNFYDFSYWPKERVKKFVKQIEALSVVHHQIDFGRSPREIKKIQRSIHQVNILLEKEKFEFVHCHTPMAGVIGRICCHRYRVRVFYTAHGFHFFNGAPIYYWIFYYPIEKRISAWTDVLITINREDYVRAKTRFYAKKTYYVPGTGIDVKKIAETFIDRNMKRIEIGVEDRDYLLFSVGELNKNKNHKVVIEALGEIRKSDPSAACRIHYCIAGIGDLHDELIKKANKLNINLHLLGFRDDIPELLKAADLFLLPSIREGLNVGLMEAMASGLACIVSDIRGNRDLIDSYGGKLEKSKNIVGWKRAIEFMLKSNREKYGEYNKVKIKKYDMSEVDKTMELIYK